MMKTTTVVPAVKIIIDIDDIKKCQNPNQQLIYLLTEGVIDQQYFFELQAQL